MFVSVLKNQEDAYCMENTSLQQVNIYLPIRYLASQHLLLFIVGGLHTRLINHKKMEIQYQIK